MATTLSIRAGGDNTNDIGLAPPISVASAATCDIGSANSNHVIITGTTTITSVGSVANRLKFVRFDSSLTLTHNAASLILPGSVNLQTAANDTALFTSDASGVWRLRHYQRAGATVTSTVRPLQGRLTLTSGTPVTTGDVTAATSVYYSPYVGDEISLYDGANWNVTLISELALALDATNTDTGYHQSGKNFDLFVFNDSGTIRLGSGPAWTSDTARGTGAGTTELQRLNGVWTNKNSITLRWGSATGNTSNVSANQATYVGSIRCTANGQTEDSAQNRLVWNCFNRRPRRLEKTFDPGPWTYTTAAYRQVNNSTANCVTVLIGLSEDVVECTVMGAAQNSNATPVSVHVGIGLDSTTSIHRADILPGVCGASSGSIGTPWSRYVDYPGLGYHVLNALEASDATGTTTWIGNTSAGSIVLATAGLSGRCHA